MPQHEQIDPESLVPLAALYEVLPGGFNAIPDIVARRETLYGMLAQMTADAPPNPNVNVEDITIAGPAGDLALRIYRPVSPAATRPALYFMHGGGMVLGNLDTDHAAAMILCEAIGAVIVSVDYRLAPEHPYPAGPDDCFAGLVWMAAHADELGFDPTRLALYGGSAGGGLAIATAMRARDEGGPAIRFVMTPYPMIDDRNETSSSQAIVDVGIWDRAGNVEAWEWYLGGQAADGYAAPARAEDLSGLPPTFIDVGDQDMFLDEDVAFAERLDAAGVPVELHVYPGAYHGSEVFAPTAQLSERIWAARIAALTGALH
ncbi:MAG: alpha/beta hydrolase fold domain-containing protein [Actinomycetales bacterium]|nr:alpha/beta hydrolase fold domain-containing protein [Actinomycetales bacterium]